MEQAISSLDLQKDVHLLGYRRDPKIWMKRALVYVSASTWEGLPGATIQAINEGVPAVVTNCKGGISAVTQNGELAYLVEVCSEEDLAGKLKKANENVLAGKHTPNIAKLQNWRRQFSIEDRVNDYHLALPR